MTRVPARFVAFVGAGASALPPAQLPTWIEFNNLLLESLCERLADYSSNRQPTQQMLARFRARRDNTKFFAPDFQAQLMEDEIGADYFSVWQSLESDVFGPVHADLAELVAQGRVIAIITTNFDRLIEVALRQRNLTFEVFHDAKSFDALLAKGVVADDQPLPVIKIHGSIEDTPSLVDTLKQRVAGRPPSLMKALHVLLLQYTWVYLGFSGADFSYDSHYLGILNAAAEAKGFIFVARPATSVEEGVQKLKESYGSEKAAILEGDLSTWVAETFHLPRHHLPSAVALQDGSARTRERIRRWVDGLGPMAVVNVLCSLLKSSGIERDAHWLLRKTWKSYRAPDDTQGLSYARYNYNYGMSLFRAGFIGNPISLSDDRSNLLEWKEHADQDAIQFFHRSYSGGKLSVGGAQLAASLAYRGEVGQAIGLLDVITQEVLTRNAPLELCDVALATAVVADIVQLFSPTTKQLRHCLDLAKAVGDEPRRAALCVQFARFLIYLKRYEEADAAIVEAERIAERLNLPRVRLQACAARGLQLTEAGEASQRVRGVQMLKELLARIDTEDAVPFVIKSDPFHPDDPPVLIKGRNPLLCRLLLDLNVAAFVTGDAATMNETLDRLDELVTQHFPGYCPHYYLAYAECLFRYCENDRTALIPELIRRAREVGQASGNPWAGQAATRLETQIGSFWSQKLPVKDDTIPNRQD